MDKKYVLSALVNNNFGVLTRVAGLFARRGYNITSLTVGETQDPKLSRMTIELFGDEYVLNQIKKQLEKLIDVVAVADLSPESAVFRELIMVRVNANDDNRASVIEIANIFRAKVVDVASGTVILELTGDRGKISAFLNLMEKYGITELARTGITALPRG